MKCFDKRIPDGFELFYNPITEKEVLRPIAGFSEKYLTPNTFIAKSTSSFAKSIKGKNNSNLNAAKINKNDEFYTSLGDIIKEIKHYKKYFKGKVIYSPCDKAFNCGRSNFVEYFLSVFHDLGLKKFICTQYNPNGCGKMKIIDFEKHGFMWEYHGEYSDGTKIDESMIDTEILKGDGSFDSTECQEIMKNSDIVITNPPFSKFREFLAQIMKYDKKFIIIGSLNAITYKEVFPLIKDNKVWLGMTNVSTFIQPDGTEKKFGNIRWYTNLEHNKRKEGIYVFKTYNEKDYPKYENYDAINVDRTKNIPIDYSGVMGVPISFLNNYNPNQFEIIGLGIANLGLSCGVAPYKKEHKKYRKEIQKRGTVDGDLYMVDNGVVVVPYARILIRHTKKSTPN